MTSNAPFPRVLRLCAAVLVAGSLLPLAANAASKFPKVKRQWEPAPLFAVVVEQAAKPLHQRAESAARGFASAVGELCQTPEDAARLKTAQARWRGTALAWARTSAFAVGPAERPVGRSRLQQLAYWPVNTQKLDALLAATPAAQLDAELVAGIAVDRKGLYAAEYLLFSGTETAFKGEAGARRCAYLQRLADDIFGHIAVVNAAWAGDYWEKRLARMGTGADYHGKYFAADELIRRSVPLLEEVMLDRLAPLIEQAGNAEPTLQGLRGGIALAEVHGMLTSLRAVLLAGYGDPALPNYLEIAENAPECPLCRGMGRGFERQLKKINGLAAALAEDGDAAALHQPEQLEALAQAVHQLDLLIKNSLARALQTPAGFNSRDGD